jgi:arylformamidase
MGKVKQLYLSYLLGKSTPTYGNRSRFSSKKKSDISRGDVANDTSIETTVHIGTHIDMPYHFFENGQTIEDFHTAFFSFDNVLFIELEPKQVIIEDELIDKLKKVQDKQKYELLIVKTGLCYKRDMKVFWESNFGFSPVVATYLKRDFSHIRVMGFDSISISSFQNRVLGREAHKAFLDPKSPILLLEDMDLTQVDASTPLSKVTIAPLRIAKCDGLPCTVIAEIDENIN